MVANWGIGINNEPKIMVTRYVYTYMFQGQTDDDNGNIICCHYLGSLFMPIPQLTAIDHTCQKRPIVEEVEGGLTNEIVGC